MDNWLSHLADTIGDEETAFFLGAGISRDSGLPIANELVVAILERLSVPNYDINKIVKSNLPFEAFMETLQENVNINQILELFGLGVPCLAHVFIAKLAKLGCIRLICTTNFDMLIEKALEAEGLKEGYDFRVFYHEKDFHQGITDKEHLVLFKIHGCISDKQSMLVTFKKVAARSLSEDMRSVIEYVFSKGRHKNVIVLGYSCSDVFDISPQIESIAQHRKRVFLVDHYQGSSSVSDLSTKINKNPFSHYPESKWIKADTSSVLLSFSNYILGKEETYAISPSKSASWKHSVELWYSELRDTNAGAKQNIPGMLFHQIADFSKAISYFESGLSIENIRQKLNVLGNLGTTNYQMGNYERAIDYHLQAIELAKAVGNKIHIEKVFGNLGNVYYRLGKYDEAEKYYKRKIGVSKHIGDMQGEGIGLGLLGNIYFVRANYSEAIRYYRESLKILSKIGDKRSELVFQGNLGMANKDLQEYDMAVSSYEKALSLAQDLGDVLGEMYSEDNLAEVCNEKGDYNKAIRYAKSALCIARRIKNAQGVRNAVTALAKALYGIGDCERSLMFYRRALAKARKLADLQGEGVILCSIGDVFSTLGRNYEAREHYLQGLSVLTIVLGVQHPLVEKYRRRASRVLY